MTEREQLIWKILGHHHRELLKMDFQSLSAEYGKWIEDSESPPEERRRVAKKLEKREVQVADKLPNEDVLLGVEANFTPSLPAKKVSVEDLRAAAEKIPGWWRRRDLEKQLGFALKDHFWNKFVKDMPNYGFEHNGEERRLRKYRGV